MSSTSDVDLSRLRIERQDEAAASPARGRGPRRRRRFPIGLLVVLALLGAGAWLLWPRVEPWVVRFRAPEVETGFAALVSADQVNTLTTAAGYVVARTRAALAAQAAGRLVELNVDVGSEVVKDQVIARIDAESWEAAKRQMEAQVEQQAAEAAAARVRVDIAGKALPRFDRAIAESRAWLRETETELAEARRVLDLEEQLAASGAGMVDTLKKARNDVLRLEAAKDRRAAAIETLQAERASAEAEIRGAEARVAVATAAEKEARAKVEQAAKSLRDTEIRAPFDGVILRKEAELGEMVVPALAGGGTSRGSVVTIADFSTLEMEVDVFERDIAQVTPGAPARIILNAHAATPFRGAVRQIVPTAERSKGTVLVKVAFEWPDGRPDRRVLPEMGGKVEFQRARPEADAPPEVRVPARALTTRGGARGVFVLDGTRIRWRAVETGAERGDSLAVARGLGGNEQVVLDPQESLDDGATVRPLKPGSQDG